MNRYDVVYGGSYYAPSIHLAPHFCREWDDEGGCYGSREDHGYSWEEARAEVARWHREKAEQWAALTEDEYFAGERQ